VSPPLVDLAASFRRHLRAAGKAERTITLYLMSVRFFGAWLQTQGRSATLDQLTRPAISAWLADLMEVNESSTALTRLRGLRRFCRWLVVEGELDKAPTEGVELPDPVAKPVRILSDDELAELYKACAVPRGRAGAYDRRIFDGRRDEMMLCVLVDCGVRVSELVGLTLTDVDQDRDMVYVVGKGSRPRAVPIGQRRVRPSTGT
jgi:site-specific recombinase XerD